MPAAASDKLLEVGDPGTATTLASPGYTSGVSTSINVASTTNWPTATGVAFAIDETTTVNGVETRVAGTYNEFIGTVASGTQVTNVDYVGGDAERSYAAGASTRVYVPITAERENRIVEWGVAQHSQAGAHTAITATSLTASGNIETTAGALKGDTVSEQTAAAGVTVDGLLIKDGKLATANSVVASNITAGIITNAMLSTTAGQPGADGQSWTPTLSGRLDDADWTKTCSYIEIGKLVFYWVKLVATAAAPMGGGTADAIISLPVTAAAAYIGSDQTAWIGGGGIFDSGTAVYQADVYVNSASADSARIRVHTASAGSITSISSTVPFTWTTNDEITCSGFYRRA